MFFPNDKLMHCCCFSNENSPARCFFLALAASPSQPLSFDCHATKRTVPNVARGAVRTDAGQDSIATANYHHLIGDIPSGKGEGEWPRPCIVCIEKGGSGAEQLD